MMRRHNFFYLMLVGLMLVGCGAAAETYSTGDVLLTEDFSDVKAWEFYESSDGVTKLEVSDGAYTLDTGDEGYIWGLNEQVHQDVVMEVTTNQLSSFENNAYGVMCRADVSNNGDGYYFMISGDGFYSIARGEGEDVNPIVDWETSSAINEGTSTNKIRAVCLGDELSFYVNDRLVASVTDTMFDTGYAGFVGTAFDGGTMLVTFDDLTIWQALPPAE